MVQNLIIKAILDTSDISAKLKNVTSQAHTSASDVFARSTAKSVKDYGNLISSLSQSVGRNKGKSFVEQYFGGKELETTFQKSKRNIRDQITLFKEYEQSSQKALRASKRSLQGTDVLESYKKHGIAGALVTGSKYSTDQNMSNKIKALETADRAVSKYGAGVQKLTSQEGQLKELSLQNSRSYSTYGKQIGFMSQVNEKYGKSVSSTSHQISSFESELAAAKQVGAFGDIDAIKKIKERIALNKTATVQERDFLQIQSEKMRLTQKGYTDSMTKGSRAMVAKYGVNETEAMLTEKAMSGGKVSKKDLDKITKASMIQNQISALDSNLAKANVNVEKSKVLFDNATGSTKRLVNALNNLGISGNSVGGIFLKTASKVGTWLLATTGLFAIMGLMRKVGQEAYDLEFAFVGLRKVLDGNDQQIEKNIKKTREFAMVMNTVAGSSFKDTIDAVTIAAQAGFNFSESLDVSRAALIAVNVAELTAGDATKYMVATIRQFNLEAKDSIWILNQWNELSNKTGAETHDVAEAVTRAGQAFKGVGGSLSQLGAIAATTVEATGESGERIGRMLRTVSVRYSKTEGKKSDAAVLAPLGIQVYDKQKGEYKNITETIYELGKVWGTLSEKQRMNIAVTMAGTEQSSRFRAAIENSKRTVQAMIDVLDSENSALDENTKRTKTMKFAMAQLGGSLSLIASSKGALVLLGSLSTLFKAIAITINTLFNPAIMALGAALVFLSIGQIGTLVKSLAVASKAFATFLNVMKLTMVFALTNPLSLAIVGIMAIAGAFAFVQNSAEKSLQKTSDKVIELYNQTEELKSGLSIYLNEYRLGMGSTDEQSKSNADRIKINLQQSGVELDTVINKYKGINDENKKWAAIAKDINDQLTEKNSSEGQSKAIFDDMRTQANILNGISDTFLGIQVIMYDVLDKITNTFNGLLAKIKQFEDTHPGVGKAVKVGAKVAGQLALSTLPFGQVAYSAYKNLGNKDKQIDKINTTQKLATKIAALDEPKLLKLLENMNLANVSGNARKDKTGLSNYDRLKGAGFNTDLLPKGDVAQALILNTLKNELKIKHNPANQKTGAADGEDPETGKAKKERMKMLDDLYKIIISIYDKEYEVAKQKYEKLKTFVDSIYTTIFDNLLSAGTTFADKINNITGGIGKIIVDDLTTKLKDQLTIWTIGKAPRNPAEEMKIVMEHAPENMKNKMLEALNDGAVTLGGSIENAITKAMEKLQDVSMIDPTTGKSIATGRTRDQIMGTVVIGKLSEIYGKSNKATSQIEDAATALRNAWSTKSTKDDILSTKVLQKAIGDKETGVWTSTNQEHLIALRQNTASIDEQNRLMSLEKSKNSNLSDFEKMLGWDIKKDVNDMVKNNNPLGGINKWLGTAPLGKDPLKLINDINPIKGMFDGLKLPTDLAAYGAAAGQGASISSYIASLTGKDQGQSSMLGGALGMAGQFFGGPIGGLIGGALGALFSGPEQKAAEEIPQEQVEYAKESHIELKTINRNLTVMIDKMKPWNLMDESYYFSVSANRGLNNV